MASSNLEVEQQQQGGEEPSSGGDGGNHEKEVSRTEHAQKSEVEAASSTDACKKQPESRPNIKNCLCHCS